MPESPTAFLPLKAEVFHILLVLREHPRHGYGVMQDVETRSGGLVRLQPGALYRELSRLLDDGLITETPPPRTEASDDSRRRYYRLTPLGVRVAAAEAHRLGQLVAAARRLRLTSPDTA